MEDCENLKPQPTADGSFTFFSTDFGEAFHSYHGARQESLLKFVDATQLIKKAEQPVLRLLDVCYGLGYNTASALSTIWSVNPDCYVEVIGLELNQSVPQAVISQQLFDNWEGNYLEDILYQLAFENQATTHRLQANLLIGDARKTIESVCSLGFQADAIFLDPFSPPVCPQLWTVEFMQKVAQCLKLDGLLATYSCAAAVRTALLQVGLKIGSTPPVGRRTPGTVAAHQNSPLSYELPPLSVEEQEHLQTRAAIVYRDPQLCDSASEIIQRRQLEQQTCSLEPTSRWRKRWLLAAKN
jgi:tRNA U34 5-methylaminomethyl-2-thiouridine-forming methyltransferase MnmC